jgi:hypothetical protein
MRMREGRQFIRHPAQIPIEIGAVTDSSYNLQQMNNVSLGGLAFKSECYWEPGVIISIRVPTNKSINLIGKVVWCQQQGKYFDVGVQFIGSPNANSQDDLVEEVCQIEIYKKMLVELAQQAMPFENEALF